MNRWWRRALAVCALGSAGTALLLACGPFFSDLVTVRHSKPADPAGYARGELGVVKPTFERRYLAQAYRTLGGLPPLATVLPAQPSYTAPAQFTDSFAEWMAIQKRELPAATAATLKPVSSTRIAADYSSFDNCLESAFAAAAAAFKERAAHYGARHPLLTDWVAGQAAVFQNCGSTTLVLPAPITVDDPRLRADRDYQTAAAYFYATQYDEAAGRFRAIAGNAASPWRPFGRYLAARALIRSVTVPAMPPKDAAQRIAAAERDLQATLADKDATTLHASARGLLGFAAARGRPLERLHELAGRISSAPGVAPQDLVDYTWLMDLALGENTAGTSPFDLAAVTKGDDLTDWIVATQKRRVRAVERWQQTRSERWLVAAMWTAAESDPATAALLDAAAQVPRTSPAFATVAFLRVRLLIRRNDPTAARAVLAALPDAAGQGVDVETFNLLQAARFTVATSLDELLTAAPRTVVAAVGPDPPDEPLKYTKATWDDDVAAVFNSRMALDRLVDAAESTRLPTRLRHRVAQAAFTRAVLLARPQAGIRAARVMAALETAPSEAALRADLRRYIAATDEAARTRIGVLTLLGTSGLSINVGGRDDDDSYAHDMPALEFGHTFPHNWWCKVEDSPGQGAATLIVSGGVPFPAFITDDERRATATELEALKATGTAREYLAAAAIDWARQRRTDPEAAQALALAIEGWRWSSCYDNRKSDLPRRAFALLHRQFPNSDWAKQTKYWYD